MVAGLPLFKLASLAIKQSAKPVANVIKRGAKESEMFKKYLCYYPGQGKQFVLNRKRSFCALYNVFFSD